MNLLNTISHLDIFDLCDCLEDNSIDMILCDPPYQITNCSWDVTIPFEPMWECFKRIIKPRGAIVLTASGKFTYKLVMSNFDWFKYEWVWEKTRPNGFITAKTRPLTKHEMILVFSCGTIANCSANLMSYYPVVTGGEYTYKISRTKYRATAGERKSNFAAGTVMSAAGHYPNSVIKEDSVTNGKHPTQKPVALFEYLIRTYTQPGETVFDPTCGSGTTAIAARNTGRNFVCGDSSEEYVKVARERLAKPYTLPMFEEAVVEDSPVQAVMELG